MRRWVRDHGLGIFFLSAFLAAWLGQLVTQWFQYASEQKSHREPAHFWSADFWYAFGQSTLENWQSEFLQVATFVIAAAYLVYKGSSESPDGEERLEAKLDALLEHAGLDPAAIEKTLPDKFRRRAG